MKSLSLLFPLLALGGCGETDGGATAQAAADPDSCRAIEDKYIPRFEELGSRGEVLLDRAGGTPSEQDIEAALGLQAELRSLHAEARAELAGCTGPKRQLEGLYGEL
ncbi:hypothetical protein WJT74_10185 [Sphingomicrobium sp. XHP0239]|uniref:hypothetical protein n=1 Tax=Sphingomicrobium maritimum TaxID=3133972 RepID=UPI0031CC38B0